MTRRSIAALLITVGAVAVIAGFVWLAGMHPGWSFIGAGVATTLYGLFGIDVDTTSGGG